MGSYGYDMMDGKRVPQTVVGTDHTMTGIHDGTVHVEAGEFRLLGVLRGTLDLQRGVVAHISGTQQGTVDVAQGARAYVTGEVQGSTNVCAGATLVIEPGGRLAGCLHNEGLVVLRGVLAGPNTGAGELQIEGDGHVEQPRIVNGIHYYHRR